MVMLCFACNFAVFSLHPINRKRKRRQHNNDRQSVLKICDDLGDLVASDLLMESNGDETGGDREGVARVAQV